MADSIRRKVDIRLPPGLLLILVAFLLWAASELLIPIALAILVTFLLAPLVKRLERARVPRGAAVLACVLIMMGLVGALGWVVHLQALNLATRLPEYKTTIREKFAALRPFDGAFGRAGKVIAELEKELDGVQSDPPPAPPTLVRVVDAPTPPLTYARSLLGPVIGPLATIGIVVVFSIFMLYKREDLRDRIVSLIGAQAMHLTTPAFDDAAQRITRYLVMQVVVNAAAGLLIGIGLFFLGVPGAALWGLLTALLRFVPYIGAWIGAVMPLVVSIAVSPGWAQPALALALIATVEIACANFVEPLVFRSGTGLSPLAILLAAVFWAWLWGPVGLLLATPLTVCLAVIGRHVPALSFLDVMLRNEPGLPPDAQFYQRLLAGDQHAAGQIVEAFAKDKTLAQVYDSLVIPAIRHAEDARHRRDLEPDAERAIRDLLAAVVEDAGGPLAMVKSTAAVAPGGVLCLPARDWADELAAEMLAQLLRAGGISAEVLSCELLSGEMLAEVERCSPLAVCVSATPPAAAVHIRVLCKRLRAKFPALPILAGLWNGSDDDQAARTTLGTIGTDLVATNLSDAVAHLQRLAGGVLPSPTLPIPGDAAPPKSAAA